MTYEEAVKLCSHIRWADGGCSHCVTNLMNSISKDWPEIDWRKAFSEGDCDDGGAWNERELL
jgi:hypothetical protein